MAATARGDTPAAAYDFGELPLRFESQDRAWLSMLERRYGRFRARDSGPSAFTIRFESQGAVPPELGSPLAVRPEPMEIVRAPGGFRATSETTICEVDLTSGEAVLSAPSAMYPLDNLLVQLLPVLSTKDLLFHAAAVALGGGGLLAAGPSGAGKSTLASLAGDEALCDEMAAARRELDGFRVLSLPFWAARPGAAPLNAILLLEHGEDHVLTPLAQGEALRRLATALLWPTAFPETVERVFSLLVSLLENVPVFELAFAPRTDVVSFLRKELS